MTKRQSKAIPCVFLWYIPWCAHHIQSGVGALKIFPEMIFDFSYIFRIRWIISNKVTEFCKWYFYNQSSRGRAPIWEQIKWYIVANYTCVYVDYSDVTWEPWYLDSRQLDCSFNYKLTGKKLPKIPITIPSWGKFGTCLSQTYPVIARSYHSSSKSKHLENAYFAVHGFKYLCEISKGTFGRSHKILDHTQKYAFYWL